jgi:hypothetical protein
MNWVIVKGFENYEVNEEGVVRHRSTKRIKHQRIIRGYYYCDLHFRGKRKNWSVHRIVATHFVKNLDNKPEVNHIDGDKFNNHYSNLEWCTRKENLKHARDNYLIDNIKCSSLSFDDILFIRTYGYLYTGVQLSKMLDTTTATISRIKNFKVAKY